MAYDFSEDWFSSHIPTWDQIIHQKRPRRIVEVGSYEGRSASYIIERCGAKQPVELWCIDTWQGSVENSPTVIMGDVERRFDRNIAEAKQVAAFPVTVNKVKSTSTIALAELLVADKQPSMDLIYVDGSHQAPDVLSDAVLGFALLKVGGVMIFDDYLWCMEEPLKKDPLNMPKSSIDAFINIFMRKLYIIRGASMTQIYLEKIAH